MTAVTPEPEAATPGQAARAELTDLQLLEAAARALRSFALRSLTVRTSLDKPYPDDPRWSPWTRWLEPEARRAHDLAHPPQAPGARRHPRKRP